MSGVQNTAFENDSIQEKSQTLAMEPFDNQTKSLEEPSDEPERIPSGLEKFLGSISGFLKKHSKIIKALVLIVLNILILAYFVLATIFHLDKPKAEDFPSCEPTCGMQWCDGYGMLLLLLFFVYFGLFYYQIFKRFFGKRVYESFIKPISEKTAEATKHTYVKLALAAALIAAFITYIILDTTDDRDRLRSLMGIVILLSLGFIFSKHPSRVNWRTVITGFTFQFLLGIFCIRWAVGRSIFICLGDKVKTFLGYATEGSLFVFGEFLVSEGVFSFAVLPVIFFFSFMISILYYYGAMQFVIKKLGWMLQSLMGTTVCESITAAANIFLGMSESPLLIRPYIKDLTHSEIHVIMASGFATVSGTVLAAYISFGADPAHLITSSVMAAPAVMCFGKLFYPETEKSKTTSSNIQMAKATDSSVLDAASNGAVTAISLILGIIANIVAFVAFIAFLNGLINWLGLLVGEDLDFEWILQRVFTPLAYILGVPWGTESENVGRLIATKTVINEFVAYERLGIMQKNGEISARSAAIATYAVCGFANPSSLGIMIAALSTMAPERRGAIASVAWRAFIAGSCICFITASIAGILMPADVYNAIGPNEAFSLPYNSSNIKFTIPGFVSKPYV